MATIGASTTHTMKKKVVKPKVAPKPKIGTKVTKGKKSTAPRGGAPPLKSKDLSTAESIAALKAMSKEEQKRKVVELLERTLGEVTVVDKTAPRTASTTQSRSFAAADVAVAAHELGLAFCLKQCQVMDTLQRMLFPDGVAMLFSSSKSTLKPSKSTQSLDSMDCLEDDFTTGTTFSGGTDSKRGKSTPANAREGSLLLIRALCEKVGKPVEPYVLTGFLAAALDECGSSSSAVREAAEDASRALVSLANEWAFPRLICPMLLQSFHSTEWRVKYNSLERLSQCAKTTCPLQVYLLLPQLIPEITGQIFDTKAQVTKAASDAMMAICQTCRNPDVKPAIPAVVHAICKPSDTYKAVEELMATTFVAPVDASVLSILCPILSRALKEKLAIRKRSACLVIKNMSRLVESPQAVAPFGPLLVPELQKVANNVQFEEIRDAALSALQNLTKALGDMYKDEEQQKQRAMDLETARVEEEQRKIEEERAVVKQKDEARRQREEAERKKFKEAMDAQRELDKLAEKDAAKAKIEDDKKKDKQARSTKGTDGKCQSCGLKKCKKGCMFFGKK